MHIDRRLTVWFNNHQRADGGIGRHVRLRGVCASVRVQVPLRAPTIGSSHLSGVNPYFFMMAA